MLGHDYCCFVLRLQERVSGQRDQLVVRGHQGQHLCQRGGQRSAQEAQGAQAWKFMSCSRCQELCLQAAGS